MCKTFGAVLGTRWAPCVLQALRLSSAVAFSCPLWEALLGHEWRSNKVLEVVKQVSVGGQGSDTRPMLGQAWGSHEGRGLRAVWEEVWMEEGPGRLRLRGWEEWELCVRYSKCGVPQRGVMGCGEG